MASCSTARNALIFAHANAAVTGGYSIKAKGSEAEIYLYGDVGDSWFGGVTAKQFADDLKAAGKVDNIHLHINSPGGDVFDGLSIYRLLVDHKAKVIVHIDGLAASIASVIALAGDRVVMQPHSQMMIHNPWALCVGDAADMREAAERLDRHSDNIASVYAERGGGDVKHWRELMQAETWFTAAEAWPPAWPARGPGGHRQHRPHQDHRTGARLRRRVVHPRQPDQQRRAQAI